MNNFGSHIKIDWQHRTNLKICSSGIELSNEEFYVASDAANTIRRYTYEENDEGDNEIVLLWESEVIPDWDNVANAQVGDFRVFPDGSVVVGIGGTSLIDDPVGAYMIDPDGNIIAESDKFTITGPTGFTRYGVSHISFEVPNGDLYMRIGGTSESAWAKLDRELNTILIHDPQVSASYDGLHKPQIMDNKLFGIDLGSSGRLYEFDTDDLTHGDYIDFPSLSGSDIERTRQISPYIDGKMLVALSGDSANNNTGYIGIINTDLTIDRIIRCADYGMQAPKSTGIGGINCTSEGYIILCNTSDLKIYLFDPDTNTLLWEDRTENWGTLSSSRPIVAKTDTFDNIVILTGIGSDPNYVIVYNKAGDRLAYLSVPEHEGYASGGMDLHYADWQRY